MANPEHVEVVKEGTIYEWRKANPDGCLDLSALTRADLAGVTLEGAHLDGARLIGASLAGVNMQGATLRDADLSRADLSNADLREAGLDGAWLVRTNLRGAELSDAHMAHANLNGADLSHATLHRTYLSRASLLTATLRKADCRRAVMSETCLVKADLQEADLRWASLWGSTLVKTQLAGARMTGCKVYGASVWDLVGEPVDQADLTITPDGETAITVDNLEIAQFVYLVLNNPKIRDVINTIGKRGVLILGRFGDRKPVLEAIRAQVRKHKLLPMVFDFERPTERDMSETVLTLAGMSRFVIADITGPRSAPHELELTVPNFMIPFVPLIQKPDKPYAMFQGLWTKHRDWVLDPLSYSSVEQLERIFEEQVIRPANERRTMLLARKADELVVRDADEFEGEASS